MWAAKRGDCSAVDLLIKTGADVDRFNDDRDSASSYAARLVDLRCIKALLKADANATVTNNEEQNALHSAMYYQKDRDFVKLLIEAGTNVNGQNIWGSTSLSYTAWSRHITTTEALLDYGADINVADFEEDTPLFESILYYADDVMQLLLFRGVFYTTVLLN